MINGFFCHQCGGSRLLTGQNLWSGRGPGKGSGRKRLLHQNSQKPGLSPGTRMPPFSVQSPHNSQNTRRCRGCRGAGGSEAAALTSCPGPGLWDRRASKHKILEGKALGGREATSFAPRMGGRSGPSFGNPLWLESEYPVRGVGKQMRPSPYSRRALRPPLGLFQEEIGRKA